MEREAAQRPAHAPAYPARHKSEPPAALPTRGTQHDALAMFLGVWEVRGYNAPVTGDGARTAVHGVQRYAWVPGEFFVNGVWEHRFGARAHAGVAMLGFDIEREAFFSHHYDNLGYVRQYQLTLHARTWAFSGEWERATFVFGDDGQSYCETWQLSKDTKNWQPLCVLEARRRL